MREMTHIPYYIKGSCHQHITGLGQFCAQVGSLYVSGKLPTYPSPKPTLTLTSHLGQNIGLGEGKSLLSVLTHLTHPQNGPGGRFLESSGNFLALKANFKIQTC